MAPSGQRGTGSCWGPQPARPALAGPRARGAAVTSTPSTGPCAAPRRTRGTAASAAPPVSRGAS
eukprot:8446409-Pyramimonas_sp.AAC.2